MAHLARNVRTTVGEQPRARRARRRRRLLPALLILGWLAASGYGGSYFARLATVQDNSSFAALPAATDAARVQVIEKRFSSQTSFPAIVIWRFGHPVEPGDRARLTDAVRRLRSVAGLAGPAPVQGPLLSRDRTAAEAVVAVDSHDADRVAPTVAALRAAAHQRVPAGATVWVTGPAAFSADLSTAFNGLDGVLLLVAFGVVALILVVVYRSPLLPFLVLLSAGLALSVSTVVVYHLAKAGAITLNGQSQGILFILAVGATTDYSLLLVSRYREELRAQESAWTAMAVAYRACREPIAASAGTVILGLLCLLISSVKTLAAIGPVAAIGVAASLAVSLSFLPAVLVLAGRGSFWPFRPAVGSTRPEGSGLWGRVSGAVAGRPRRFWVVTGAGLIVLAGFYGTFQANGIGAQNLTLGASEAKSGEAVVEAHFPAGAGDPAVVVVARERAQAVSELLRGIPGVSSVTRLPTGAPPAPDGTGAAPVGTAPVGSTLLLGATTEASSDTVAAQDTVLAMRAAIRAAGPRAAGTLVGGTAAAALDVRRITATDRDVIIPIVLALIFVILAALLRALLLPVLVVLANVLSYGATVGIAALFFNHVFHFAGSDPSIPLIGFVFLVALGVDYSIFLMTRVREETMRRGATVAGVRAGLAGTGGVITSAGVVLAATFTALAVIPVIFLAQIGFLVAVGVLLDTFVVRSILLPALSADAAHRIWWPSRLWRAERRPTARTGDAGRLLTDGFRPRRAARVWAALSPRPRRPGAD